MNEQIEKRALTTGVQLWDKDGVAGTSAEPGPRMTTALVHVDTIGVHSTAEVGQHCGGDNRCVFNLSLNVYILAHMIYGAAVGRKSMN